ncbi:MAG: hypothetical protein HW380_3090 [Magnetococcales bacterium]|nr:hypothetical protein [Magnetococcales bacterium]
MTTLVMELPNTVFSSLRRFSGEFAMEMRKSAAIHWYQKGLLSQEIRETSGQILMYRKNKVWQKLLRGSGGDHPPRRRFGGSSPQGFFF